jgi:putative cell wall-binding protein
MNRRKSKGVRFGAGLAAVAVGATLPIVSQQASAVAQVDIDVVTAAGENRYDTAAQIAAATFATYVPPSPDPSVTDDDVCVPPATPVQNIVLATGQNFPDALAANALAGSVNAPILLTRTDSLPPETLDAIVCLHNPDGSTVIHIVGGPSAVGPEVRDALAELPVEVTDEDAYNGRDRYLTAIKVARTLDAANVIGTTTKGEKTGFITTGANFADAVAVGPVSFYGKFPILLVNPTWDPNGAQMDELIDVIGELELDSLIVLGGPAAVPDAIFERLEQNFFPATKVSRLAGATRIETATAIADFAQEELGWVPQTVLLARADDFADALAGGPHGGQPSVKAPVLLTSRSGLSEGTRKWLDENDQVIRLIRRLGGNVAVPRSVVEEARQAAQTQGPNMLGAETDAPELQYVRLVNDPSELDSANLLEYVFDQPVEASDVPLFLLATYFRLYVNQCEGWDLVDPDQDPTTDNDIPVAVGGTYFHTPITTSIVGNGNVVRARFPVQVESGARATVQNGAVQNDEGIFNAEGAYPIRPTACPGAPGELDEVYPRLERTTNWALAPRFAGDNRVSVDYWFENPQAEEFEGADPYGDYPEWLLGDRGTLEGTAPDLGNLGAFSNSTDLASQFWLVGNQSTIWQGDSISITGTGEHTDPASGKSYYRVRVFFTDEVVSVTAGALRRGYVEDTDASNTEDESEEWGTDIVQAGPYFTTSGATGTTVDPDLVQVRYVGELGNTGTELVEYTFDEAVSSTNLDEEEFAVYDRDLDIQYADAVSVKSGTGARVVEAQFVGGIALGPLAGGFVLDTAVRGTDQMLGVNNGYNRNDEKPIGFDIVNTPDQPGQEFQAGYTFFPDLKLVIRTRDSVTGNFRLSYLFDQSLNYGTVCSMNQSMFSVYDDNGVRIEEPLTVSALPATPSFPSGFRICAGTALGTGVTFDGGLGAPVINNDDIQNATVAGVRPNGLFVPVGPFTWAFASNQPTEGSAIVMDPSTLNFGLQRFPNDPETQGEGDWEVVDAQPGT